MTAPICVLGHRGMVGRAWMKLLGDRGIPALGIGRPELDLTKPETIVAAIQPPVRAVINCAAYTDVDGAEANEAEATAVNGHGVGRLVDRCDDLGVPLVQYSTDYVFGDDGRCEPYPVTHPPRPLNAYGRSKLVGERAIEASRQAHLIVRTSWVYAPWGKNFVTTIARLTKQRAEIKVVADQRGRPTSAMNLAGASLQLFEQEVRGIFHITDKGECSWWELATEIARRTSCSVAPCTTDEFPRPARRPAYSVLDLSRTESVIGPLPSMLPSLEKVLSSCAT